MTQSAEHQRLAEDARRERNWKRWGPYLAERQWGTVREDYSRGGDAWTYADADTSLRDFARLGVVMANGGKPVMDVTPANALMVLGPVLTEHVETTAKMPVQSVVVARTSARNV